jgi:membrane-associated protease RseP (regulator of RpoE activity)
LAFSPLEAMTVLAKVILVHEAGHYVAAHSSNISVKEFSIGFVLKLLSFKALGN